MGMALELTTYITSYSYSYILIMSKQKWDIEGIKRGDLNPHDSLSLAILYQLT